MIDDATPPRTVYRNENYHVTYAEGGPALWICFDHAHLVKHDYLTREGWGEATLLKRGHSVISVKPAKYDWYMLDGWVEFFTSDAFAQIRKTKERIICYGLSMGGTGALIAGSLIDGCTVVSVAPQSSIFPDIVDFERRFNHHAEALEPYKNSDRADITRLTPVCDECYIFYCDDHVADRSHIERLDNYDQKALVKLAGEKHIPMAMLIETGALSKTISILSERSMTEAEIDEIENMALGAPQALLAKALRPDLAYEDRLEIMNDCYAACTSKNRKSQMWIAFFSKLFTQNLKSGEDTAALAALDELLKEKFFFRSERSVMRLADMCHRHKRTDLADVITARYQESLEKT